MTALKREYELLITCANTDRHRPHHQHSPSNMLHPKATTVRSCCVSLPIPITVPVTDYHGKVAMKKSAGETEKEKYSKNKTFPELPLISDGG